MLLLNLIVDVEGALRYLEHNDLIKRHNYSLLRLVLLWFKYGKSSWVEIMTDIETRTSSFFQFG
jgi:hypothetical protein